MGGDFGVLYLSSCTGEFFRPSREGFNGVLLFGNGVVEMCINEEPAAVHCDAGLSGRSNKNLLQFTIAMTL